MAGEEWARRIVQKELAQAVSINDDGSAPGMYDLRIGPPEMPDIAIECVGAVDSTYAETWNVGPARGPLLLAIKGDWNVEISAKARVKAVRQNLERLLQGLESRGVYGLNVDYWLQRCDAVVFHEFDSCGITHASCYRTSGTGKVHLSMPGTGGVVDEKGSEVPRWLGGFLRHSARTDVLAKLQRSGARAREAFVVADLGGVPWPVESYLTGDLGCVPSQAPELPSPVTGAWVVSGFGRKGLYWDGTLWRVIVARGEDIDD